MLPTYPKIIVNGVDLTDTDLRWGMDREQALRNAPGKRVTSTLVPGRSGVLRPSYREPFEANTFTIRVIVFGRGTTQDQKTADLDLSMEILTHVFTQDTVNVEYWTAFDRRRYSAMRYISGTADYADAAKTAIIATYVLEMTDPRWRGTLSEFEIPNSQTSGQNTPIPIFQNSTASIDDSMFIVKGPFTSVQLQDRGTLQFLRYTGTVAWNQALFLDTANFYAAIKSNSTSWNPTIGVVADVSGNIVNGGPRSSSSWLTLNVDYVPGVPGDRRVYVNSKIAAIGGSTAPTVQIRGRAAYL